MFQHFGWYRPQQAQLNKSSTAKTGWQFFFPLGCYELPVPHFNFQYLSLWTSRTLHHGYKYRVDFSLRESIMNNNFFRVVRFLSWQDLYERTFEVAIDQDWMFLDKKNFPCFYMCISGHEVHGIAWFQSTMFVICQWIPILQASHILWILLIRQGPLQIRKGQVMRWVDAA